MKKIILGTLLTLLITSCGTNEITEEQPLILETPNEVNIDTEVEVDVVSLDNEPLVENLENSTAITFKSIEENLKRLENVNIPDMELEELNNQINYIYISSINEDVLNKKDISLCDVLTADESSYCKTNYIYNIALSEKNTEECKALNDEMLVSECNNYVNGELAYIELDITYCQKLTSSPEEISNCENNIYKELAVKNRDITYCDKIITSEYSYIKDECLFELEMFKEQDEINLELELKMSKEQDKIDLEGNSISN